MTNNFPIVVTKALTLIFSFVLIFDSVSVRAQHEECKMIQHNKLNFVLRKVS